MTNIKNFNCIFRMSGLILFSIVLSGCLGASNQSPPLIKEVVMETSTPPPPGTVQYIWEEPMVDVVDVPPGVDPEGIYYRPSHDEVVEIRQGRWRAHRFQGDSK